MASGNKKKDGQALTNELEGVVLFPELDLESIASMPIEEVDAELERLGLNPNEPLPHRIIQLVSGNVGPGAWYEGGQAPISKPLMRIVVVGIGGGGGNAINHMIESGIEGVEFVAVNTDLQMLKRSRAQVKVQLGGSLTRGLGAGGNPDIGWNAALQDTEKLIQILRGADMVFLTAGLGGGTGTGASPIIAALATELGALTVAVVTKPFLFEGSRRMRLAEKGLCELQEGADTVITIHNERLIHAVGRDVSVPDSFKVVDDVLLQAVKSISDIITIPGLINLDFADVKTIMASTGLALVGLGRASGQNRAVEATKQAIISPLMEEGMIKGAKGVLINITCGNDLKLHEVNEATSIINKAADPDANIIFGTVIDEEMHDEIKVTIIATSFSKATSVVTTEGAQVASITPIRQVQREDEDLAPSNINPERPDDIVAPPVIRKRMAN